MTPFNWDHPSLRISHGARVYGGDRPLTVPKWILPKASWWTPRRMGIAVVAYSFVFAFLLGCLVGAR